MLRTRTKNVRRKMTEESLKLDTTPRQKTSGKTKDEMDEGNRERFGETRNYSLEEVLEEDDESYGEREG